MAKSSSPMSVMIFWALFDDLFLGPSRKEPRRYVPGTYSPFSFSIEPSTFPNFCLSSSFSLL